MQHVSLIEELLLLTLEDAGGEFDEVPEVYLTCGVAGAALIDLSLQGRIDSDLRELWVADPTPTGDPVLDRVLAEIAAEPARLDPRAWIVRLAPKAPAMREAALASLCAKGILYRRDQSFLWVLHDRRYPVAAGQERPEAKRRLLALLFNDDIPHPEDAALVALADACFVFERFFKPAELKAVKPRIEQLGRLDLIGGAIVRTAHELNLQIKTSERRTVIAGLAGNVMEWYDFGVYGFFAAAIGQQFFPAHDPTVSLLASFGVFAVGFIARPLGGLVFGHIGDRRGRRAAVVASVLMMVVPTLLMGLLPTYETIGIAAPALLVALRLLQGLAVGGEYTTSMVLLVEEALPSRRGRLGSYAPLGSIGGLLLGSLVGAAITAILPPQTAGSWGWRAAFLTGVAIGALVFIARRRLPKEPEVKATGAEMSPIRDAFRTQWTTILKVIGFNLVNGVGFYMCFIYMTTWLLQTHHFAESEALALDSFALVVLLAALPASGIVSDRIGRKPLLLLGSGLLALLAWPLFWLISQPSLPLILAGLASFGLIVACFAGACPAFMVEAFPKHVRCSGLSVGYNLSLSIFGGTVPLVSVALIAATGDRLAPAFYLMLAAALSFVMATLIDAHPDEARAGW
ncbi:MFS transporter [Labrys monachus]|uniref:MFS family permease n=1 Tax=Labrys monachus TaxID=217067 RepID=A0ABU0FN13_9HYPH|nr:MFS transporter [Labrys monachus]MDQ0395901.1 MFS family permease [Labrys monachus]